MNRHIGVKSLLGLSGVYRLCSFQENFFGWGDVDPKRSTVTECVEFPNDAYYAHPKQNTNTICVELKLFSISQMLLVIL